MAKILITEKQLQKFKNQLLMESNDNTYRREVNVRIDAYKASFKGKEIADVTANEGVVLNFIIDMEARSWGVKSIILYGIKGPETLNIRVDYYINESGDTEYEYVDINLDWNKLDTEERNGEGIITIDDDLTIDLGNDENGNLIITGMGIDTYTL